MTATHFIKNRWVEGLGENLVSFNPINDAVVWEGRAASSAQIDEAVLAAEQGLKIWAKMSLEKRMDYLTQFQTILKSERDVFKEIISRENGKPLWESDQELGAMINKIPLSFEAYQTRCKTLEQKLDSGFSRVIHKPHGVVAVFSPFNFPAHLPNAHIIPALLAGNTIVLKPSELTPLTAQKMIECWERVNLPAGVINLVQGGAQTGKLLSQHPKVNGVFFTGSFKVGSQLSALYGQHPEKILALEMGGNNPLVVHNISKNVIPAVYNTLQSAYITSGQRCSCARRLIVTKGKLGEQFVEKLIEGIQNIIVGPFTDWPEPFMGPVISKTASDHIMEAYQKLLEKNGIPLVHMQNVNNIKTLLSPALMDVTPILNLEDEEIFGPLLQLKWVDNLDMAIVEANKTAYGLTAGIFCEEKETYQKFLSEIRSGLVNWNRPTTGASGHAPFGGIGKSGNFRPSGYYAADYCAYPVSVIEETALSIPKNLAPGINL